MARLVVPSVKRNVELERRLVGIAAMSIGQAKRVAPGEIEVYPIVESLNRMSEARAWPGNVPVTERPVPLASEAMEELADLRSYLAWLAQSVLAGATAGDGDASDQYGRAMRALALTVAAWAALHGH